MPHSSAIYLNNAELSTEQNCNMIDGIPNNTALPVPLHVMVSEDEPGTIHQRMTEAGISNAGEVTSGQLRGVDKVPKIFAA